MNDRKQREDSIGWQRVKSIRVRDRLRFNMTSREMADAGVLGGGGKNEFGDGFVVEVNERMQLARIVFKNQQRRVPFAHVEWYDPAEPDPEELQRGPAAGELT